MVGPAQGSVRCLQELIDGFLLAKVSDSCVRRGEFALNFVAQNAFVSEVYVIIERIGDRLYER